MPPLRSFTPIKAIKTERTHEENQERAYIAASRRSDRSLEARVESARRASEIHKRRTGRSLKVTEQDVINEEMYEEEDDDLPSQYRRLTAHLQTGSADFNRRLAAYLTNHVAMRSALDQAITSSYAQQFPNAPQFAHNHPGLYPSPLLTHGNMNPPQAPQQQESPSSPHPYRQSPYPMPGMAGYRRQSQHHRTASVNVNDDAQKPSIGSGPGLGGRRLSMPTPVLSPSATPKASSTSPASRDGSVHEDRKPEPHIAQDAPAATSYPQSISPLTTTLPTDSQLLLGPALNPANPFDSMLMGGNSEHHNFFGSYFSGSSSKDSNFYPNLDGMNTTLAPSASMSSQPSFGSVNPHQTLGSLDHLNFENLKGNDLSNVSEEGSASGTPGIDGSWDAFINENSSWAENAT